MRKSTGLWHLAALLALLMQLAMPSFAQHLLVPMDATQTNHLKAYGLTYWSLEVPRVYQGEWLLNYRGGSFLLEDRPEVRQRALAMEVHVEPLGEGQVAQIRREMDGANMDTVVLEKAPKVAVYAPPDDSPYRDPWDDAVKIALDYAEIPFTLLWDRQVLVGDLHEYDWVHLHHEDFTGQYGKFYGSFRGAVWYQQRVHLFEAQAQQLGFGSVAHEKGAVSQAIQDYVLNGGFLFAMCSAPETMDIALAAGSGTVDIVSPELDGTPIDPDYAQKLDFRRTFAFEDFRLDTNPNVYEFSDIDNPSPDMNPLSGVEDFELFEFSAKHDPIPTMLTQNHVGTVRGFLGQTTSFRRSALRDTVTILGNVTGTNYTKYIHGKLGKGIFTFLGGHDPEDYSHRVGEGAMPTNLELHKHSPGYRLILNNVLFPAARQKKQKT